MKRNHVSYGHRVGMIEMNPQRLFLSSWVTTSGIKIIVLLVTLIASTTTVVVGWTSTTTTTTTTTAATKSLFDEPSRSSNRPFNKRPSLLFLSADSNVDETSTTTTTTTSSTEEKEGDTEEKQKKEEEGNKRALQLSDMLQEVGSMRLSEIKEELKQLDIDFSDCFDKDSMVSKLANARINGSKKKTTTTTTSDNKDSSQPDGTNGDTANEGNAERPSVTKGEFDRDAALDELNKMRIRELREELGRRRISRAGLFEKEDLVNALLEARAVASVFSAAGMLTPGEVTELSEDDVRKEIDHSGPLLLLDVYATWCGPCQMIAPFLKEIANEQGDQLRVVKMDSDKNPRLSSELKVQGLPTLVLFQGGAEIDRIEGAPTKEQLTGWIDSHR